MDAPERTFPRLRPLDFQPHVQDGEHYVLLRDPMQLQAQSLLLPQAIAPVLRYFDGAHDAEMIAQKFTARYQTQLGVTTVCEIVAALDGACLLENERATQAYSHLVAAYRSAPMRPPLLAGRSYPAEPEALRSLLDHYLAAADVPVRPRAAWPRVMGMLSPHIDYPRGGSVYAAIWKHAREAIQSADIALIFGTDHYGVDPLTLTRQNYATPYGILPTAQEIVDLFVEALGEEAAFAGELRHRDEHSLELVAVWLHHMRGGAPCPIVPILTGSPGALRRRLVGQPDTSLMTLFPQLQTLTEGKRVVIVSSGDLAHVGVEFGDRPLTSATRQRVYDADMLAIEQMCNGDSEGFYASIDSTGNRFNVCGLAPTYMTMRTLEALGAAPIDGVHFGYDTCPADATDTSMVTICGVAFTPSPVRQ